MKTMFDPVARRELNARLDQLTPDRPPQWGKFSAPQMVCHVADSLRMAYGDITIPQRKMFIRFPVIKYLIIYVFPFPKGAPTAPQLLARAPAGWNGEIETLRGLIDRFETMKPGGQWAVHPAFGYLSGRSWGALAYKHIDHHFRQFAV